MKFCYNVLSFTRRNFEGIMFVFCPLIVALIYGIKHSFPPAVSSFFLHRDCSETIQFSQIN